MSGGTLVALAAHEILMDPDAGPRTRRPPARDLPRGFWPAVSDPLGTRGGQPDRDDQTLILGDMARKASTRCTIPSASCSSRCTDPKMPSGLGDAAQPRTLDPRLSHPLSTIRRDRPARKRGATGAVYDLMALYSQRGQRRPSVEYVPVALPQGRLKRLSGAGAAAPGPRAAPRPWSAGRRGRGASHARRAESAGARRPGRPSKKGRRRAAFAARRTPLGSTSYVRQAAR